MIKTKIVTFPIISEDCKKVKVSKILFKKGEYIDIGKPYLEVETDKAVLELPAEFHGRVLKLLIKEGEEITLGTPICILYANPIEKINSSLNYLSDEFKSLEELQQFYYNLTDMLDLSHESTPEDILSIIKKRIS